MCIWRSLITAFFLLPLSTSAQQTGNSRSSPATEQTTSPTSPRVQPDPQPPIVAPRPQAASTRAVPPSSSVMMYQIVDRAIERERALIEMLKARTPFVETYLQDLKVRPQEGPVPVQDH